jgi:hypothetical protein
MTDLSVIRIGDTGIYRRSPVFRGIYKFLSMTFLSLKKGTMVIEFGIRDFPGMASGGLCVIIRGYSPRPAGITFGGAGVAGGFSFYQAEGFTGGCLFRGRKQGTAFLPTPPFRLPRRGWRVDAAVWEYSGSVKNGGGVITCVSRGAGFASPDGKPRSRAGGVRPAAAIRRRGGQDGRLRRKKRKHGRLRFFLPCGPRLRPGAVPPPLSR